MGNGYISYKRRNEKTGLENQCWKDSWNSISYSDGRLPGFPRATCELQGYAYDAKMRGARLARLVWKDPAFADRLEQEAADLKRRFNRDFWLADRGLLRARARRRRQPGRLARLEQRATCSGAASSTQSKAKSVVEHLMGPRLFSGWGVAHAGRGRGPLQPDRLPPRHGLAVRQLVHRLGPAAVRLQGGGGADRVRHPRRRRVSSRAGCRRRSAATTATLTKYPVQYPTACSPQAWSTGAPLLLLRTMLGLEPIGDHLVVDPALPARIGHLELLDIPGRWGRIDALPGAAGSSSTSAGRTAATGDEGHAWSRRTAGRRKPKRPAGSPDAWSYRWRRLRGRRLCARARKLTTTSTSP